MADCNLVRLTDKRLFFIVGNGLLTKTIVLQKNSIMEFSDANNGLAFFGVVNELIIKK